MSADNGSTPLVDSFRVLMHIAYEFWHIYRHLVGQYFLGHLLKAQKSGSTAAFAWHCKKSKRSGFGGRPKCHASNALLARHVFCWKSQVSIRYQQLKKDINNYIQELPNRAMSLGSCILHLLEMLTLKQAPSRPLSHVETMPLQFFALPHRNSEVTVDSWNNHQPNSQLAHVHWTQTNNVVLQSFYLPNPGNSNSGLIHSPQPLPMASDDLTVLLRNARTEMPSNMPSQYLPFTLQLKSCKFHETWHKLGKTTNRSVPTCPKLLVHAY